MNWNSEERPTHELCRHVESRRTVGFWGPLVEADGHRQARVLQTPGCFGFVIGVAQVWCTSVG